MHKQIESMIHTVCSIIKCNYQLLHTICTYVRMYVPVFTVKCRVKLSDRHAKFPAITWLTCSVTIVGDS